jgi:hypothetical protein
MKTKWVGVGTLVLLLVGLGNGCVDNDKSLVIVYNVAPSSQCQFEVQTGTTVIYIPYGVLDLTANHIYMLTPQIENFMPNSTNKTEKDINTLDVQVQRAEITYRWLVGRDIASTYDGLADLETQDPFVAPISGVVSAADSSGEPGKMVTILPLFSSQVQQSLSHLSADDAADVVLGVRVRVFGQTTGGSPIKSNEFIYPLRFCTGCTIKQVCCAGTTNEKEEVFCIPGQHDSSLGCSC